MTTNNFNAKICLQEGDIMGTKNKLPINRRFHNWIGFYVNWCSFIALINQEASILTIKNAEWFNQGNSYAKHEYLRLLGEISEKLKTIAVNGGKLNSEEALLILEDNSNIIRDCGINMVADHYQNKYNCTFNCNPSADRIIELKKILTILNGQAQMFVNQVNNLEGAQTDIVPSMDK